jgi:AcrR family transcriptional regulator
MVRRTADDTRRLILEAALQMLLERGATAGVQHIRLQEVLRSVGLTTGAAYRIWADQTDFHRDLAVEMVGLRFAPPVTSASTAIQEVLDSGGSLDDVARVAALDFVMYASKFHLEPESRDSHAFITALALRTAAGSWPELRVASAERHRGSIAAFAQFYGALLQRYGRRVRSPLTIVDFTEAMAALGEGFAVRAAEGLDHPTYDIPEGGELPSGEWTLFGIGIQGLVAAFTIPISDDGASPGRSAEPPAAGVADPPPEGRRV